MTLLEVSQVERSFYGVHALSGGIGQGVAMASTTIGITEPR